MLFDEDLTPWLLEINSAPSLVISRGSETDRILKPSVVEATLRIVTAHNSNRDPTEAELNLFRPLQFENATEPNR